MHVSVSSATPTANPVIAGFVVPKTVGNAVVRNRVRRRLRALLSTRLQSLPAGSRLVVRVTPAAAGAASASLAQDLDSGLSRALASARRSQPSAPGTAAPAGDAS